jgi:hypothetical protein
MIVTRRQLHWLLPALAALLGFGAGVLRWPAAPTLSVAQAVATGAAAPTEAGAEDRVAEARAVAMSGQGLRDFARLGALLERLDAGQMAAFMDALEKDERLVDPGLLAAVIRWWTGRDAAAAGAWMAPRLRTRLVRPFVQAEPQGMVLAWAKADPASAMRYAREHPHHALSAHLLVAATAGLAGEAPADRLRVLQDFPASDARREAVEYVLSAWLRTAKPGEARAAVELAGTFPPGPEREAILQRSLARLSATAPLEALARAQTGDLQSSVIWQYLVAAAAAGDAPGTAKWLAGAGRERLVAQAGSVVEAWAGKDAAAALTWAAAHDLLGANWIRQPATTNPEIVEPFARGFGRTDTLPALVVLAPWKPGVIQSALTGDPMGTLEWIRQQPAGPDRERWIELAVQSQLAMSYTQSQSQSPESIPGAWRLEVLGPLVLELPVDGATDAVGKLVRGAAAKEKERVLSWVTALPTGPLRTEAWVAVGESPWLTVNPPPGPDRDAYLTGQIGMKGGSIFSTDQEVLERADKIFEGLKGITDESLRHWAFDRVLSNYAQQTDSKTMQAFAPQALERAAVPEDWKEPWRKKLQAKVAR